MFRRQWNLLFFTVFFCTNGMAEGGATHIGSRDGGATYVGNRGDSSSKTRIVSQEIVHQHFFSGRETPELIEQAYQKATTVCIENVVGMKISNQVRVVDGQFQFEITNSEIKAKLERLERLGLSSGTRGDLKYLETRVKCTLKVESDVYVEPLSELDEEQWDDFLDIGRCVRTILEDRVGGELAIPLAVDFYRQVRAGRYNPGQLLELSKVCNKQLRSFRAKQISRSQLRDIFEISRHQYTSSEEKFLRKIIYPISYCTNVRLSVGVGWILGIGFGLQAGICEASQGSHWMEVGMGPSLGFVGGALVILAKNHTTNTHTPGSPLEFDTSREVAYSIFFGAAQTGLEVWEKADPAKGAFTIGIDGYKEFLENANGVTFGAFECDHHTFTAKLTIFPLSEVQTRLFRLFEE